MPKLPTHLPSIMIKVAMYRSSPRCSMHGKGGLVSVTHMKGCSPTESAAVISSAPVLRRPRFNTRRTNRSGTGQSGA